MIATRKISNLVAMVIMSVVLIFLGYYLGVVQPAGAKITGALVQLKPEQVTKVRFYTGPSSDGKIAARNHILSPDETATFLTLVSRATPHTPNHPNRVWGCQVEILTTTKIPKFDFTISSTSNDGLQLRFYSSRSSWNYGTLRNDALKPFVEAILRRK